MIVKVSEGFENLYLNIGQIISAYKCPILSTMEEGFKSQDVRTRIGIQSRNACVAFMIELDKISKSNNKKGIEFPSVSFFDSIIKPYINALTVKELLSSSKHLVDEVKNIIPSIRKFYSFMKEEFEGKQVQIQLLGYGPFEATYFNKYYITLNLDILYRVTFPNGKEINKLIVFGNPILPETSSQELKSVICPIYYRSIMNSGISIDEIVFFDYRFF